MPSATVALTKYDIASLVMKDGTTPTAVDLDLLTYADHSFTADRLVNVYEEIPITRADLPRQPQGPPAPTTSRSRRT